MTKETADILLEALRKCNPDYGYCISEEHWAFNIGTKSSEWIFCIIPKAPAEVSRREFKSESELVEYINILVGDQPV